MDATPLDQLVPPPGGSQQPSMSLPAATTYPQMITPGTTSAISFPPPPNGAQMHPMAVKSVLKNILGYVAIFAAVFVISLTPVQSLVLRYIPGSYAGSGVVSLSGAAVLGAIGVVLVYILQTLLQPLV
jgi:hypothetical protein